MSDLVFKINVETEAGRKHSWNSSSFARSDEVDLTTSTINTRINNMWSASYTNDASEPSSVHGTPYTNFGSINNYWLSASNSGEDTGSIILNHTDSEDTADRLKRYRFYGTKVCNVLGFPEGQWQYPVNFQLDDTGTGTNYFSGDVNANRLSVARDISFSPLSNVASNIRFNIDGSVDKFIQFTSGSATFQENRFLIGYNTDNDRFECDAGIQTGDGSTSYLRFGYGNFYSLTTNNLFTNKLGDLQYTDIYTSLYMRVRGEIGGGYAWYANPVFQTFWTPRENGENTAASFAIGRATGSSNSNPVSGSIFVTGDWADISDRSLHLYPTQYYGDNKFMVHMDLDVTGSNEIVGGTRAYFDGGESSPFSSDRYLDFNNGTQMTANLGYRMHRPGSITGVSAQWNVTSFIYIGSVDVEVRKNGSNVFSSGVKTYNSTGATGNSKTQARGTYNFVAGDILTLYVNIMYSTVDDFCAFFEVTYDT